MLYLSVMLDQKESLYFVINDVTGERWSKGYKRWGNARNRMGTLYGMYQQESILQDEDQKDKGLTFDSMGLTRCPNWPACLSKDFSGNSFSCNLCESRAEVYVCPLCLGSSHVGAAACYLCRRQGYVPWSIFHKRCPTRYEKEWSTTSEYATMTFEDRKISLLREVF